MNATQQFLALVAERFTEIEQAKLDLAEQRCNAIMALADGKITRAEYDAVLAQVQADYEQILNR